MCEDKYVKAEQKKLMDILKSAKDELEIMKTRTNPSRRRFNMILEEIGCFPHYFPSSDYIHKLIPIYDKALELIGDAYKPSTITKYKGFFFEGQLSSLLQRILTGRNNEGRIVDIKRELMSPREIIEKRVYETNIYEKKKFSYTGSLITNMLVMVSSGKSHIRKLVKYEHPIAKKIISSCHSETKKTYYGDKVQVLPLTKEEWDKTIGENTYLIEGFENLDFENLDKDKILKFILEDEDLIIFNKILTEVSLDIPNRYFRSDGFDKKDQFRSFMRLLAFEPSWSAYFLSIKSCVRQKLCFEAADFYMCKCSPFIITKPAKEYANLPFS